MLRMDLCTQNMLIYVDSWQRLVHHVDDSGGCECHLVYLQHLKNFREELNDANDVHYDIIILLYYGCGDTVDAANKDHDHKLIT